MIALAPWISKVRSKYCPVYMSVFKPPLNVLNHILGFLDNDPYFFEGIYVSKSLIIDIAGNTTAWQFKAISALMRVNDFVSLPKYDIQSITTEGHDQVIHSDQIVDYLAFNKEWLDMSLNVCSNCLVLISVKDDSMESTLRM